MPLRMLRCGPVPGFQVRMWLAKADIVLLPGAHGVWLVITRAWG